MLAVVRRPGHAIRVVIGHSAASTFSIRPENLTHLIRLGHPVGVPNVHPRIARPWRPVHSMARARLPRRSEVRVAHLHEVPKADGRRTLPRPADDVSDPRHPRMTITTLIPPAGTAKRAARRPTETRTSPPPARTARPCDADFRAGAGRVETPVERDAMIFVSFLQKRRKQPACRNCTQEADDRYFQMYGLTAQAPQTLNMALQSGDREPVPHALRAVGQRAHGAGAGGAPAGRRRRGRPPGPRRPAGHLRHRLRRHPGHVSHPGAGCRAFSEASRRFGSAS